MQFFAQAGDCNEVLINSYGVGDYRMMFDGASVFLGGKGLDDRCMCESVYVCMSAWMVPGVQGCQGVEQDE